MADDNSASDDSSSTQIDPKFEQKIIDGVVLIEVIGEGGFGTVFSGRVVNSSTEEPTLAIKKLPLGREDLKKEFEREFEISQELDRRDTNKVICRRVPNPFADHSGAICAIKTVIDTQNNGYIIFPFVKGEELFDLIGSSKPERVVIAKETLSRRRIRLELELAKIPRDNKMVREIEKTIISAENDLEDVEAELKNSKPYNQGGEMRELIKNNKLEIWLKTCLIIASKLYNTLLKMHNLGIYHRDIKPSNILIELNNVLNTVTKKNIIKLNEINVLYVDFGLACVDVVKPSGADSPRAESIINCKNSFLRVGTPGYFDVDYFRFIERMEKKDISEKTFSEILTPDETKNYLRLMDLHALGVTVYQMLNNGQNDETFEKQFVYSQINILKPENKDKFGNFGLVGLANLNQLLQEMTARFSIKFDILVYAKRLEDLLKLF